MTRESTYRGSENTPEFVAYRLMKDIADVEKMVIAPESRETGAQLADRQWILDTYAECMDTVVGNRFYDRRGGRA